MHPIIWLTMNSIKKNLSLKKKKRITLFKSSSIFEFNITMKNHHRKIRYQYNAHVKKWLITGLSDF